MAAESSQYHVCIIRTWCEQATDKDVPIWRDTLEIPSTSQRRGFTSRAELVEALSEELNVMGGGSSPSFAQPG